MSGIALRGASFVGTIFAAALLAPAPAARAQVTREHELPELEREPGLLDYTKVRITVANRFVGKADYGTFQGSSNQPEARLRVDVPVAKNAVVRLIGTGRAVLYDWKGTSNLPGALPDGDPFGDLFSWDARLQAAYLFDEDFHLFSEHERWAVVAEGGVKVSFEEDSHMWDGMRPRGGLALGFRWRDRFEAAVGLNVAKKLLDDGVAIGPLVEFDWDIDENWSIKSYGLGLQIDRKIGRRWLIYTRARLEGGSFRLADRGGSIGTGSVQMRQLPVGVGVRWKSGWFTGRVSTGVMLLQRLKIKNGNGDSIGSETASPSPFVTVRIDLRP